MDIRSILVLLALFAADSALADAYVWTDEDGVVHYSDRPQAGAKRIDLAESKRPRPVSAQPAQASAAPSSGDATAQDPEPFRYQSLEVAAPAAEETLWNIEGVLNVSLALSPALQPNHEVRVYFDGNPRTVRGTNFQLEEVYRGVHNLQAEVVDETGKLMIRSRPNRFYVQQSTVRIR